MSGRRADREASLKQIERWYRKRGWDAGYAGRPCTSTNATFMQAWKRGKEQRARDQ